MIIYLYIHVYTLYMSCIFLVESGGFTWEGIIKGTLEEECPADELPKSLSSTTDNIDKTVIQTAEEVQLVLGSLKQVMSRERLHRAMKRRIKQIDFFNCFLNNIIEKYILSVIDIYHRRVQRRLRPGNMVELLRVICDQCHGHVLSIVLLEYVKWSRNSNVTSHKSSLIHRSAIHYYSIVHRNTYFQIIYFNAK